MRTDRNEKQKTDTNSGVSEIIGAILLISVVTLAVAIIAVFFFSQPTPTKIPNLNFMTGVNGSTLYLYHNGGDALNKGEFSVLLDGVQVPSNSVSVSGGGSQWSLGKNLVIPITKVPQNVQIVYNSTSAGGAVLLDQAAADIVSTVNVTADQLPYLDCSAVRNWDCADQIPPEIILARYTSNSTTKRLNFMQGTQSQGCVNGGSDHHFNFTVTKPNSTMHITDASSPNCDGGTLYKLPVGTNVGVVLYNTDGPTFFTVYGMAPQIWELMGGAVSTVSTTLSFPNGTRSVYTGRIICHSYIEEYANLSSTLDVSTTNSGHVTFLIVNKTKAIEGTSTTIVKLINVSPMDNGLFEITYGYTNSPIFVIGWADAIQYNGVTQVGLGL